MIENYFICSFIRDLETNRKIARRRLRDKLDLQVNGEESRLSKKFAKIRRKKDRASRYDHWNASELIIIRRGKQKYNSLSEELLLPAEVPPN